MSDDKNFIVWNKSGRRVGKGDYIVRKCDGRVMEIESEYPDFFVVSGEYPQMSILNKNTNYSKFYLWTPNAVNVGDVLTSASDNTVFVVESIERGESGLKFGSGIFMDDYWNSSCELHFRQEDRWFDANNVRPASSSAIVSIASALNALNRMQRKDTRKPDDGSSADNKSSEPTHYGSYGEKFGFYEFKK